MKIVEHSTNDTNGFLNENTIKNGLHIMVCICCQYVLLPVSVSVYPVCQSQYWIGNALTSVFFFTSQFIVFLPP